MKIFADRFLPGLDPAGRRAAAPDTGQSRSISVWCQPKWNMTIPGPAIAIVTAPPQILAPGRPKADAIRRCAHCSPLSLPAMSRSPRSVRAATRRRVPQHPALSLRFPAIAFALCRSFHIIVMYTDFQRLLPRTHILADCASARSRVRTANGRTRNFPQDAADGRRNHPKSRCHAAAVTTQPPP